MTVLPDASERARVLTELDATLLVEAAAGTGKTALMAARVTMLLLRGVSPKAIAAITFTELAASELVARVHRYVDDLLDNRIPQPLAQALPNRLDAQQRSAISDAAGSLGQLTTATIHAFCQAIITNYAVEADIDPGARILDADQADAAFDAVFERWLKRRLSGSSKRDDPVVLLSRDDPRQVVSTLKELARFRLRYRGGKPAPSDLTGRPDVELTESVAGLRSWIDAQPANSKASELATDLDTLASHFDGKVDEGAEFATLWHLAHPPQVQSMYSKTTKELRFPSLRGAWVNSVGQQRAIELEAEARNRFERIHDCYGTLLGTVSTAVVASLSSELDEVLAEYHDYKRRAAVFDFDDLLERARALVGGNEAVRRAIGERYRHICVDEFQDTDPIQCEILFLIAAESRAKRWQECRVRAGSLFLVGDPKQAIYRFRGADVGSYKEARAAIEKEWPLNIVQITANFRSRPAILAHVNRCFAEPLSGAGQPGYVHLSATIPDYAQHVPSVSTIAVDVPAGARSAEIRDTEAEQVAHACARLIGNVLIQDEKGAQRLLRPGDIALLAPTGTDLWLYERALEEQGLPIGSQAGKSLYRRQETQDLLALARTLADPSDGIAFGALLRGPLVGLTEEDLLEITAALPQVEDKAQKTALRLSVLTRLADIEHPLARGVISILQDLRRRSRWTTPALLVAEAVERLNVRPILAAREGTRSARALANVEAFIDRARPYSVSGMKKFVRDVTLEWRRRSSRSEGRVDADGDAIEIITIHSSKGLEWPVVIPINTATWLRSRPDFVHRQSDNTLHWIVGDVVPPGLRSALTTDEESQARERERLWYVACTRARELLIVPRIAAADSKSWARVVSAAPADLPELDLSRFEPTLRVTDADAPNEQNADAFQEEQARIAATAASLVWVRPSEQDPDRLAVTETADAAVGEIPEEISPIGAGRVRGLILHKLIEEALTGELAEEASAFTDRARLLTRELVSAIGEGSSPPDPSEMATTALRTLQLPDVAALKARLVPELPVYGVVDEEPVIALAGRVDAVAFTEDGQVEAVIDWKSDVSPTESDIQLHAAQLEEYLRAVEAPRGALIYMTSGTVRWIPRG